MNIFLGTHPIFMNIGGNGKMSPMHSADVLGHLLGPALWEDEEMLLPRLRMDEKERPIKPSTCID